MKNQENQTPIELATAEDVKCLLQDAMTVSIGNQNPSTQNIYMNTASSASQQSTLVSPTTETITLPSGASMTLSVPVPHVPSRSCMSPAQGAESHADMVESSEIDTIASVANLLIRYVENQHISMLWKFIVFFLL